MRTKARGNWTSLGGESGASDVMSGVDAEAVPNHPHGRWRKELSGVAEESKKEEAKKAAPAKAEAKKEEKKVEAKK